MSYSDYRIGVMMTGSLDPSDHEDQQEQLEDMEAIVRSMAMVLEWMFGYSAIRPVPCKMLVEKEGV